MLNLPCLVGSQAKLILGAKYAMPWLGIALFTIPTEAPVILFKSVEPEPRITDDSRPACSFGLVLKSQRKPRLSEKFGLSFQSSWPKKLKFVDRNPMLCWDSAPVRRSKLIPGSS